MKPTILIDTRERTPWGFDPTLFDARRATLATGDYTVAGMEDRVAVERKSIGDIVNTVMHDWMRFRKELVRLSGFEFAAVIIEADVSDLFEHRYESDANPWSVWGRLNGIGIDHGINVTWWGSRKYCEPAVGRLFKLLAKKFELAEAA